MSTTILDGRMPRQKHNAARLFERGCYDAAKPDEQRMRVVEGS